MLRPAGMGWGGAKLWVVDANVGPDDAIYEIDPADGTVLSSFLPDGATFGLIYGIAFDGDYFWLSDINTNQIHLLEMIVFESSDTGSWSGASSID